MVPVGGVLLRSLGEAWSHSDTRRGIMEGDGPDPSCTEEAAEAQWGKAFL